MNSRAPNPLISLPGGSHVQYNGMHPASNGPHSFYTINYNGGPPPGQNGQSFQMAPLPPNYRPMHHHSFHGPPPDMIPPSYPAQFVPVPPTYFGHNGPFIQAMPTFVQPHLIQGYHPTGGGQSYPYHPNAGYPGPPAMDISNPPSIAMPSQQLAPPVSGGGGFQSNVTNATMGQTGSQQSLASSQQQSQHQQPPLQRERKILELIDPTTNKDIMEEERKKMSTQPQHRGTRNAGGLWRPPPQQPNLQIQHTTSMNLPTGANSAMEQRPSRSGSSTPHLEPSGNSNSGRPASRGESPALENSQKDPDAVRMEFLTQFADRLAEQRLSDQADTGHSASSIHEPDQNDATLMPPPGNVPAIRTPSRPSSRQSSSRTPPPTPPPVSVEPCQVQFWSKQPVVIAPSTTSSSSGAEKKAKDILGKPQIQFGWLDDSTGEKSLENVDIAESQFLPGTKEKAAIGGVLFCSTPRTEHSVSPDISHSRSSSFELDPGRKNDGASKSPRDRFYTQQQQIFNGGQPTDKVGHQYSSDSLVDMAKRSSGASSVVDDANASFDRRDSIEEGEIRDGLLDRSQSSVCVTQSSAQEDSAKLLAVIEKLNASKDPNGRLCYNQDFMMAAKELPASKTRPPFQTAGWSNGNIDEVFNLRRQAMEAKLDSGRMRQSPMPQPSGFTPHWVQQSSSMDLGRQKYPGRLSDTSRGGKGGLRPGPGVGGGGGGGRGGAAKHPPLIIARPSLDVELKSAGEKAWKPGYKAASVDDQEQSETLKLFKEVRSILNKITPQTFNDLSEDFLALEPRMNTAERAAGVVDVVFQKAVDEPSFCATYSELYDKMTKYQLNLLKQCQNQTASAGQSQAAATDSAKNAADRETNFRWILLSKCQREFERDKSSDDTRQEKEEAIANAETPEQKKQLQDELDAFMMKEKRRTLGNMRFIGELYLRNMLTNKIMHRCVMELLHKKMDEESLESICKLLTTIGKKLDNDKDMWQAESYYPRLKELSGLHSSRVRFMIMDLLDLRENQWQPRRRGEGPKTIKQLHKDAEQEKWEKQQELLKEEEKKKQFESHHHETRSGGGGRSREVPNSSNYGASDRADHDGRKGGGGGRERDQHRAGGRQAGTNVQQPQQQQQLADLSKAKAPTLSQHLGNADAEVRLGPSSRAWSKPKPPQASKAAVIQPAQEQRKSANRYEALAEESLDTSASSAPSENTSFISPADLDLDADVTALERFVKEGEELDIDGLMEFIVKSNRIANEDDEISLHYLGALVKSLCSRITLQDEHGNSDVDVDGFKRFLRTFHRFVTGSVRLEKRLLDALADVCNSMDCPKGVLVTMLTSLHDASAVSNESFREWWQAKESSLPAMISSNGEIKQFFGRFQNEAPSEAGSDSDQGE